MDINSINLNAYKTDESNYNWISNILYIGIDNLLTKWIDNNKPFRLVMVESKKCYMCDNKPIETWSEYTDDFDGKFNRFGWIYCKKCVQPLCLLIHLASLWQYLFFHQN